MSRLRPQLLRLTGSGIAEERAQHLHDARDIRGTFSDISLTGDFWSSNWDGSHDLSGGPDSAATAGFFFDASAGIAQVMGMYWDTGSVSPLVGAASWLAVDGWTLPAALTQITYTDIVTGLASVSLLVDLTINIQASGLTAGQSWGAQVEVQSALRGLPFYSATPTTASPYVSGSTSAEAAHTHTTGGASADHTHTWSDTSGTSDQGGHEHNAGTLDTAAGGTGASGSATAAHTHDVAGASATGYGPDAHSHGSGTYGAASGGAAHTHTGPSHTHNVTGQTGTAGGSHTHAVSGTTSGRSADHTHTAGAGSSHAHTFGGYGTHAHTVAKDTITLRWVGQVDSGAGTVRLGVRGTGSGTIAHIDQVEVSYMIWRAPVPPHVELVAHRPVTIPLLEVA